jgi:hypothetical protein
MCEKCVKLDSKIERLQASRVSDQSTLDGIKELIERMQAQKAALHPEEGALRRPRLAFPCHSWIATQYLERSY